MNKEQKYQQIIEGLFPIAEPGPVKSSLWAAYEHATDSEELRFYASYVEHALQQIDRNHETGSMLVAGQVLATVLIKLVSGTSDEPIVKRLIDSWDHAVYSEQGPLSPKELTREA